jgi:hypothetical protein
VPRAAGEKRIEDPTRLACARSHMGRNSASLHSENTAKSSGAEAKLERNR